MSIISHLHSNTIGGFRKLTFWLTESSSYTYLLTLSNTRLVLLIMAEPFMEFPVSEENILRVFLGKYFWWVFFDEYFQMSIFLKVVFWWVFSYEFFFVSVELFPTSLFQHAFPVSFFLTNISDEYFPTSFLTSFFQQVFQASFSTCFFYELLVVFGWKISLQAFHLMTCYKFNPLIGWNYSIQTGELKTGFFS